ncbi:ERI1 exoribonuclease 3-like protein [Dinothrombium tinctorium]|uniref:ERI1 exoribonuclease 3-like protein n=1 Tax=Dinothrombium tinctorium TaxID=1965070 RepID=A0A3S3S2A2_9ACAR|nr:ERI1 exoribonuclease 3-like protein [Dinothrombium tinctorium]
MIQTQDFDSFLVLDFEATCDRPVQLQTQEIIEFPVIKLNGQTFEIESVFQTYVKPSVNPVLTPFCTQLTGIMQETVDNGVPFETALQMFIEWMRAQNLIAPDSYEPLSRFAFITFGNWDLQKMLVDQCNLIGTLPPEFMQSWINLKKSFAKMNNFWPNSLSDAMNALRLPITGRLHSGVDDCENIAAAAKKLAESGHVFKITNKIRVKNSNF